MRSLILIAVAAALPAWGAELVQLDPFSNATRADPRCAEVKPRLLTPAEVGAAAHARAERGTRCAMEGTCEPGGAYRRDPELNEKVRAAIAADRRFADTSVWVTTSRRWVTLQGCVRTPAQRAALVKAVGGMKDVERVFDELVVR